MKTMPLHLHSISAILLLAVSSVLSVAIASPIAEYPLSSGSQPAGMAVGPDGNVWFTETADRIGRLKPDGSLAEFALTSGTQPFQIVIGADGNLWFVGPTGAGRMKLNGVVTPFATHCSPQGFVTAGPKNSIWFPERCDGEEIITQMQTLGAAAGTTTVHHLGTGTDTLIQSIAAGPDGNIWFAEPEHNAIGKLDVATGEYIEFSVPHASFLARLALGGNNQLFFWFDKTIGTIGTGLHEGEIEEFDLPAELSTPNFIATAPDGKIWITDTFNGAIYRFEFTDSTLSATRHIVGGHVGPASIVNGPGGRLWFVERFADAIGSIPFDLVFSDDLEQR